MSDELNGVLPVYKTAGIFTKDISRFITKKFGKFKLGHAGTLDPSAEGIVPVLIGRATRTQDLLVGMDKEYEVKFRFGLATDTLDLDGEVLERADHSHITTAQVETASQTLLGEQDQVPPLYSAVKFRGRALHRWARAGVEIDVTKLRRKITVYDVKFLGYDGSCAHLRIRCSKGTYVRSLATQLGEELGVLCVVERIVRTQASGFRREDAHDLDKVLSWSSRGELAANLVPIARLRLGMHRVEVSAHQERLLRDGKRVAYEASGEALVESDSEIEREVLLIRGDGNVVGLGVAKGQQLQLKRSLV